MRSDGASRLARRSDDRTDTERCVECRYRDCSLIETQQTVQSVHTAVASRVTSVRRCTAPRTAA
jgi:hypothetical protein